MGTWRGRTKRAQVADGLGRADPADPGAVQSVAGGPSAASRSQHLADEAETTIRVLANGPLLTEGKVRLIGPDGKVIDRTGRFSLCRCGKSGNRPSCDGAHAKEGWKVDPEPGRD